MTELCGLCFHCSETNPTSSCSGPCCLARYLPTWTHPSLADPTSLPRGRLPHSHFRDEPERMPSVFLPPHATLQNCFTNSLPPSRPGLGSWRFDSGSNKQLDRFRGALSLTTLAPRLLHLRPPTTLSTVAGPCGRKSTSSCSAYY